MMLAHRCFGGGFLGYLDSPIGGDTAVQRGTLPSGGVGLLWQGPDFETGGLKIWVSGVIR